MRAKASVFIATSLDGFIARPDGSIDWLDDANAVVPSGEDCGYKEFMKSVDVLVMGRNTFEQGPFQPRGPRGSSHPGLVELARSRSDLSFRFLAHACCAMDLCALKLQGLQERAD